MDKESIEKLAVNAVERAIETSLYLGAFTERADKVPFWDGHVYIYIRLPKNNNNFYGRMPVQIKGQLGDICSETIPYLIKIINLQTYLSDGGLLYFVVRLSESGYENQIYFSELTPIKIREILSNIKTGAKSINVQFKKFPDDGNRKSSIFLNCFKDCLKQRSFGSAKRLMSLEEFKQMDILESITIEVSGFGNEALNLDQLLTQNEVYTYAHIKGSSIPQPLEHIPKDFEVSFEVQGDISIDGTVFYHSYQSITKKGSRSVRIGKSLSLMSKDPNNLGKLKIEYKPTSNLTDYLHDTKFFMALIHSRKAIINNISLELDSGGDEITSEELKIFESSILQIEKIKCVLEVLRIDQDINLIDLSVQDKKSIDLLYRGLIEKKPIRLVEKNIPMVSMFKFAGLTVLIVFTVINVETNEYEISDFFRTKISVAYEDDQGVKWPISQYNIFNSERYLQIDGLPYNELLISYLDFLDDKNIYSILVNTLLNLLLAYDKAPNNKKPSILQAAKDFSDWLCENGNDYIGAGVNLLNRLQIVKRERKLDLNEINQLIIITESPQEREDILVGAYLLLDNLQAAQFHFNNLSEELAQAFINYPIYFFWQQLSNHIQ